MVSILFLPKLFWAELRRDVIAWWSYRLNALSSLGLWLVAFPFMMLTFDSVSGDYGSEQRLASLIGFLVWELSAGVLVATTDSVTEEARQGTLESIFLSPVPPLVIFSLRMAAAFTRKAVETTALGLALMLILSLPFALNGPALFVVGVTIASVAGLGLALGGLAMVNKTIDSVVSVIALLAVLFTGALIPINNLGTVFLIVKYLLPTTWGIDALREILANGIGWGELWQTGTLLGLSVQAIVFLFVGIVTFARSVRKAQVRGNLGSY
jgi:ABC-2 type transport system permease protein